MILGGPFGVPRMGSWRQWGLVFLVVSWGAFWVLKGPLGVPCGILGEPKWGKVEMAAVVQSKCFLLYV